MDGLTNIIAKIKEQNTAECASVIDSAKQKAEKISADAASCAEKIKADCKAEADSKAEIIRMKAVSSSELEYKRVILSQKSKILDEVTQKAVEKIADSDPETYFGYIEALVKSNAISGKGSIRMSKKDLLRLPGNFEDKLNSALAEGMSVVVSNEEIECIGGFIIEYPEIRIDCTLSSLVSDKYDEIRDEINKVLFA